MSVTLADVQQAAQLTTAERQLEKSRRRVRAQRAEIKRLRLAMCEALYWAELIKVAAILRGALGRRAPKVRK